MTCGTDHIKFGTIANTDNPGLFAEREIAVRGIRSTLEARDLDFGTVN